MSFLALPALLWLTDPWYDTLALVLAALAYRPAADLIRFATASPAARRHYLGMGDAIREYPGYSPTLLRETPQGIGTAIATLPTGTDPFCRLRVPEITEQWAAEQAAATASHRRDPRTVQPSAAEAALHALVATAVSDAQNFSRRSN